LNSYPVGDKGKIVEPLLDRGGLAPHQNGALANFVVHRSAGSSTQRSERPLPSASRRSAGQAGQGFGEERTYLPASPPRNARFLL
jgi:hypothetical protein